MADTCASLAAEIAALRAEVARIPKVDEGRIIKATRSALQPDINTAVAAGGVLVAQKLKPQIESAAQKATDAFLEVVRNTERLRLAEIEAKGASTTATRAERNAAEYARQLQAERARITRVEGEAARLNRENGQLKITDEELRAITRKNEVDARRAEQIAKKSEGKIGQVEAEIPPIRNTANSAKGIAERASDGIAEVRATATNALNKAGNAVVDAAKASGQALNAANEVTGLKSVVSGVKSTLGKLGDSIVAVEKSVGDAVAKAAKAIGISGEALSATARLGGKVLEIFNVIGTIFTILDGMATREVLGNRIDALEAGLAAVGRDISKALGFIFQLTNRVGGAESTASAAKILAGEARAQSSQATLLAQTAQRSAGNAQSTASQAQTTANGAVRNAGQANENAKTAYTTALKADEKAKSASATAIKADVKADTATATATRVGTLAEQAKGLAGQAFSKAGEALTVGLTALALYQTFKGLRGLQGIPGIPGRQGERGLQGITGMPGRNGITTVVTLPGIPGRQGERGLQGVPGAPGKQGERGIQGLPGVSGRDGITSVVTLPGTPGAPGRQGLPGTPGRQGLPGRNGRDGIDVNPAEAASLRALIIAQHNQTRLNSTTQHSATRTRILTPILAAFAPVLALLKQIYDIVSKAASAAQLALLNIINNKLGNQVVGGISGLVTRIAQNTYVEKTLAVLTFAATIHNAFMLSNNLAQTLGTVIDQCVSFIVPKGIDGQSITIGDSLGKLAHQIIADTIGEANYKKISEEWALANRIYQATANVFNTVGNAVATISSGMEVIGGNVGKIGNALKIWGVLGEKAYGWMNPQPNLHGRFFNYMTGATDALNTINAVVAVPLAVAVAVTEVNSARTALQASLNQEDPKDDKGNPRTDALGNPLKYEPGVTVPDPTKTILAQEQAKADSKNIIEATLEDIFDGGD
ncbi:hypothetical protein LC613_01065 [Nostoc sphaeroides CHAB 2801]|uniref:hypothetical protein n=1 Tax=Nostoc sphaeroides TaxID=446679 RepID=UPI000E4888B0|nr:hypothetical protein [Nostoc sphaeroides]MCC5626854.1 hypothetical protein [Nostoc sphaeroides CHAB 2801]